LRRITPTPNRRIYAVRWLLIAGSCGFTKKLLSWQRELSPLLSATAVTGETLPVIFSKRGKNKWNINRTLNER